MRISDWSSDVCASDLTDEFQVLGDMGRLNWIAGAFYSKDRPTGINVNFPQQFSFIDLYGQSSNYSTSHYTNRSVALFGQAGFHIPDKLTAHAGIRYTWDKEIGRASCGERG